jgi:hypothetical protein
MRELALEEPAALIYCPARALLHLPTWADRRRTFERIAASLRPDGRFAWNAFAFDHAIASRLDGSHLDDPVPHTIHYAVGDNRIEIVLDDGAKSRLWWATKNEWLGLLDVAGLEVEALYGGFEHEPFGDESREYVFVARRSTWASSRAAGSVPARVVAQAVDDGKADRERGDGEQRCDEREDSRPASAAPKGVGGDQECDRTGEDACEEEVGRVGEQREKQRERRNQPGNRAVAGFTSVHALPVSARGAFGRTA